MIIGMQFIERKAAFSKCLKFEMPKVPKIVERAFSTVDSIPNGPWGTFALIIHFGPKRLLVNTPDGIFVSPVNVYSSGGIQLKQREFHNFSHFRHFSAF
jgi:hypothetical protein